MKDQSAYNLVVRLASRDVRVLRIVEDKFITNITRPLGVEGITEIVGPEVSKLGGVGVDNVVLSTKSIVYEKLAGSFFVNAATIDDFDNSLAFIFHADGSISRLVDKLVSREKNITKRIYSNEDLLAAVTEANIKCQLFTDRNLVNHIVSLKTILTGQWTKGQTFLVNNNTSLAKNLYLLTLILRTKINKQLLLKRRKITKSMIRRYSIGRLISLIGGVQLRQLAHTNLDKLLHNTPTQFNNTELNTGLEYTWTFRRHMSTQVNWTLIRSPHIDKRGREQLTQHQYTAEYKLVVTSSADSIETRGITEYIYNMLQDLPGDVTSTIIVEEQAHVTI